MSFLVLNGWRISVRDGGATAERRPWANAGRARTGRQLPSRAGSPSAWDFETTPMLEQDADALVALLEGCGHHFPFDVDAHAESGLGPDTAASGNWSIAPRSYGPTGAGVIGAGYLSVSTSIVWDAQLPRARWTIAYWRLVGSAATREHVVIRSDGARWRNGAVAGYVTAPELVVDDDLGAVALTSGAYDDLVILPFIAPDDLCAAIWRWSTAAGLLLNVPLLDGSARDTVGLLNAAPTLGGTVSVLRHGGRPAGCILADAASEVVTFAAADALAAYGRDEITFEASVYPLASATAGTVLDHVSGSTGWRLELLPSSPAGRIGVRARVWTVAGIAEQRTDALDYEHTLLPNTHHHLLATWRRDTGEVQLHVNGLPVDRVSGYYTDQPAQDAANDSAASLRIGNQSSGSAQANARISGVRLHERVLSADEILERYHAWLDGSVPDEWRPFSALPRLSVSGAAVEHRVVEVAPEVLEQPHVQMPFAQSIAAGPATLIIMEVGVADSFAVSWEPHVAAVITLASGELPPGFTLNDETGVISGTPDMTALLGGNGGLGVWVMTFTITIGGESITTGSYVVEVRGTELPAPTHHWTHDDADVIDGSPIDNYNGIRLTASGGVTYGATGATGEAAQFDGTNDFEHDNVLVSKSQVFTAAVDYRIDDGDNGPDGARHLLNHGSGTTTYRGWLLSVRTSRLMRFTIEGGSAGAEEWVETSAFVQDDTWYTAVASFDGASTWWLIANAEKAVRTDAPAAAISYSATGFIIGKHDFYDYAWWQGLIDSVSYWIGTVLTDAQAATVDWLRRRGTTLDEWVEQFHPGTLTFDAPATQTPTSGVPFTFTPTFSDDSDLTPQFFRTTGTLPTGLTLTQATGVISGTPTVPGTYTPTIRCTDGPRVVDRVITFIVS